MKLPRLLLEVAWSTDVREIVGNLVSVVSGKAMEVVTAVASA